MEPAELDSAAQKILSEEQTEKATAILLLKETTKYGTVFALSRGFVGQQLELSDDQSEELFELGNEIFDDLKDELQNSKFDSWISAAESLPKDAQRELEALLKGN